jgi:hypothetical protein
MGTGAWGGRILRGLKAGASLVGAGRVDEVGVVLLGSVSRRVVMCE